MNPLIIAPSLLAADFASFGQEAKDVLKAGGDWLHLDVMDGHFVPNISFGAEVVKAIRPLTDKILDVHLMISPVDGYLESFAKAGADYISVHVEATPHVHRTLQAIRALGVKPAIALNPATPLETLSYILDDVEMVVLMSVNPGFGGQSFIPSTLQKIRDLRAMLAGRPVRIEIDGGVTADNAADIVKAGADTLVAGSSVFKGGRTHYAHNIQALRFAGEQALELVC
jgi:ribulose-phosphate 3-epimerase